MRFSTVALLITLATAPLVAQSSGDRAAQDTPRNIRLELTITDTYTGQPSSKTVTMIMENGRNSMIRTSNRLPNGQGVNLNIDAVATVLSPSDSAIRTQVTFEYTPAQSDADGRGAVPAQLHESLWVVLQDGQRLMVSESADPATDRKVTVELTATRVR